ncbi:hypothetical protein LTSEALA_3826 [Salmonella enterica subsp. enterica serovar Alachua str. R6-377]|uniref:Uncharacterized protein n=1 Tax=Salmonella enterica subsp. enterica serovar Alachua str. R6-377 TaxID=913241 RepID=G5LS65_SALET|nr:hypothetical protein LTSEALA_3826 [Salmonella enterica subsp. enterica serovar Alachua str. R6-377]
MPFKLEGAPKLADFTAERARMRVQQSRHLHSQRTAAGNNAPGGKILPCRARARALMA